jgi:hypothetical protein
MSQGIARQRVGSLFVGQKENLRAAAAVLRRAA